MEKIGENAGIIECACDELKRILIAKDADYGNSFAESIDEWGAVAYFVRDQDKTNRAKNLLLNCATPNVKESIFDTLLDKAGYAILMYTYLLKKYNGQED